MREDLYNKGMPQLKRDGKQYSFFEFWPAWLFYAPVVGYWLYLALKYRSATLPLRVNPSIYLSGMVGESKTEILDLVKGEASRQSILTYRKFRRPQKLTESFYTNVLSEVHSAGIDFPFVVKPDLGCRGNGVQKLDTVAEFNQYLDDFPSGRDFIIQKLAPFVAEAGVFYQRKPGDNSGVLSSITLKYLPYVVGDGERSLRELIESDSRANKIKQVYFSGLADQLDNIIERDLLVPLVFAGSHCRGAIFKDGNAYITDQLTEKIDKILQSIEGFHYGRLDIKFRDLSALMRGEDFYIVEINGASSEATHIWDAQASLRNVFSTLFDQYRTLFEYGAIQRDNGVKSGSVLDLIRCWLRELKHGKTYPGV